MDIKEKEELFEASCKKLLSQEVAVLNKNIDYEIEKQIKDELQEYQEKEEFTYNKKLENLERDYNKQIYNLQMESKKEVLNQKKYIQKELRQEVINKLKEFVNTPEYEEFLMRRIDETVKKASNIQNSVLSLVAEDSRKYSEKIRNKYNLNIEIIDNQYIGGCIFENNLAGIYIDNTLKNSIDEKLENN